VSARVWGAASDTVLIDGWPRSQARYVEVPEGALAAVSEGFCPACPGTALAGDAGHWCPSCKVSWHIRHEEAR
jgi:hypothetical protein